MGYLKKEAFVACRALKHSWDDIPGDDHAFGVELRFRCTRCGTRRYDVVNQFNGDLLARRYIYPKGYKESRLETMAEARLVIISAMRADRKERLQKLEKRKVQNAS